MKKKEKKTVKPQKTIRTAWGVLTEGQTLYKTDILKCRLEEITVIEIRDDGEFSLLARGYVLPSERFCGVRLWASREEAEKVLKTLLLRELAGSQERTEEIKAGLAVLKEVSIING